jgi:cytochrome P450
MVTDPYALGVIMGRGEHAVDKAFKMYTPVNYMCDPHGQPNLLTAPADDKWKAIRKAVAVSFSAQNIKKKYPMVLSRVNQVLVRVAAQGPAASVDVDQAALRVTLDVIGLVGTLLDTSRGLAHDEGTAEARRSKKRGRWWGRGHTCHTLLTAAVVYEHDPLLWQLQYT